MERSAALEAVFEPVSRPSMFEETVARLGTAPTVELNIHVQPTFVPATTAGLGSQDTRELGVRVFNVHVGLQP